MSKEYRVILFQPYLRRFFLNFEYYLKRFTFVQTSPPPKTPLSYKILGNFDQEIKRNKITFTTRLRHWLGIPNVRIRFDKAGDLFFTYGTLLITNKAYSTYIETGLALYNYDLDIAKNPIARMVVIFLATRKNCLQLIFLSEASLKSFYSTVKYPKWAEKILREKSSIIYPIPIKKHIGVSFKKPEEKIKLLFAGTFYIKGGIEIAHTYERLQREYNDQIELTIITALHMLRPTDIDYLKSLTGLTLRDATLSESEMITIYQSHHIFLLPTYRDGFGLVLIEALAYGMPLIITDQYATGEMVIDGVNGFVFKNHPLQDYNPKTYELYGNYHNPRDFYRDLLKFQAQGKLKPVEDFLYISIKKFLDNPALITEFSKHSLELYEEKFNADKLGQQLETIFLKAINK